MNGPAPHDSGPDRQEQHSTAAPTLPAQTGADDPAKDSARRAETAPVRLFDWQDAIAAAPIKPDLKIFALTVGRYGDGLSGRNIKINYERRAELLGCSVQTVSRRVRALMAAGYLVRTRKPSPAGPPEYLLCKPPTPDSVPVKCDDGSRATPGRDRDGRSDDTPTRNHDAGSPEDARHNDTESCRAFPSNARQIRGVTHDTAERERDDQKQESNLYSSLQAETSRARVRATRNDDDRDQEPTPLKDLIAKTRMEIRSGGAQR